MISKGARVFIRPFSPALPKGHRRLLVGGSSPFEKVSEYPRGYIWSDEEDEKE